LALAESGIQSAVLVGSAPRKRSRSRRWALLGVLPFFAYISIFLLIPTGELIVGAFRTANGAFTLSNLADIFHAPYPQAFEFSLELSALSAVMGGMLGFLVANAVLHHGVPRFIRPAFVSFSGMAANFAGVPLGFAYIATLGTLGVVTTFLQHLGLNIYPSFSLQGLFGCALVYMYFQLPLMILLMIPVIEGLRTEWRESASNLGCKLLRILAVRGPAGRNAVAPWPDGAAVSGTPSPPTRPQRPWASRISSPSTSRTSSTATSPSIRRTRTHSRSR